MFKNKRPGLWRWTLCNYLLSASWGSPNTVSKAAVPCAHRHHFSATRRIETAL